MATEYEIRTAMGNMWRQMPAAPVTASQCPNGCKRAVGYHAEPCINCAEKELARMVGGENANFYRALIEDLRRNPV